MNNKRRFAKIRRGQIKAQKKLMKVRAERIWIEKNPYIHILNYPFYKLVRLLKRESW